MIAIRTDLRCSFCNRPRVEVEQMLAPAFATNRDSPTLLQAEGVAICDACVDACHDIVAAEREHVAREAASAEVKSET